MKNKFGFYIKATNIILIYLAFFPQNSLSQTQVGATIYGDMVSDFLGRDVDISDDGNRIIVGLHGSDDGCNECGQVKVFQYNNDDWELLGQEINGEFEEVGLGHSVRISGDGNTIVCSGLSGLPEVVQVYRFDGQLWEQLGSTIYGNQDGLLTGFGLYTSISKDGNTIIIGARFNSEFASYDGNVKVYYFDGTNWKIKGQVFVGNIANDRLGRSCTMSASGDTIAFSTEGYDTLEEDVGRVESFAYINGDWIKFGGDIIGEEASDFFGTAISISDNGTILAAGSRSGGYAKVFELINQEWVQRGQKLTNGNLESSRYSWQLDLSPDGNWIGVSDITFDNSRGISHIYKFDDNNWVNKSGDIIGNEEGDILGPVAISENGSRWVLGSSRAAVNGENSGSVMVQKMNVQTSSPSNKTITLGIYPNPTSGIINIENSRFENISYTLTDVSGAVKMQGTINNGKLAVDSMASGLYFLRLGDVKVFPILIHTE